MINSNALYLFLIGYDQNIVYNQNLRLIQELMCTDEPDDIKFKHVFADSPNLTILTKSATQGKVQMTFCHAIIGNNYLGETVTAFTLTGSSESSTFVTTDNKRTFNITSNNIYLSITEILICAAVSNLICLKKFHNWVIMNAIFPLKFLTEAFILDGQ